MKIITEEQEARVVRMLVYGSNGVGKTRFGATAPGVLFLNCESGMMAVRGRKIPRWPIEKFTDIIEAYEFLKAGKHEYKTVVLDSVTEIQKKSMDAIVLGGKSDKPTIGDWGMNIDQMRKMFRAYRDLPMNVLFIALDAEERNEQTGITKTMPALQGRSLPSEVCGYVDIVGYMVAKERKLETPLPDGRTTEIVRMIRVQPAETVHAKDRSDSLGVWIEPDFNLIYNKIFKEEANENQS